jgi:2-oxoglutarate dehydrogenase E2 component (dihydrolipoamide succinyltransferase)
MPQLGESVVEGTVAKFFVKVGDRVEPGAVLVEIETDKANAEVTASAGGVVTQLLVKVGDVVKVGGALLEVGDGAAAPTPAPIAAAPSPAPTPIAVAPVVVAPVVVAPPVVAPPPPAAPAVAAAPAAPAVEPHLRADAVPWNAGGIVAAPTQPPVSTLPLSQRTPPPPSIPHIPAPPSVTMSIDAPTGAMFGAPAGARYYKPPVVKAGPDDTVVKFTRRRGITAEHMVYSKHVSPHVPCVAEVDMTEVLELRRTHKDRLAKEGVSLTVLAFLLKAATLALREFPTLNAVVGHDEYILRKDIHLGCAVETEEGLVVPVIRNADRLTTGQIAAAVRDSAARARNKKLTADELAGGTFTVSNPGRQGNLFGAAIINQPQVGILRMGEIVRRPVVREFDGEEVICIRSMMYLSLTYDHRIIDGVTGNGFLFRCREILETGSMEV